MRRLAPISRQTLLVCEDLGHDRWCEHRGELVTQAGAQFALDGAGCLEQAQPEAQARLAVGLGFGGVITPLRP